jgi:hypothetical protein
MSQIEEPDCECGWHHICWRKIKEYCLHSLTMAWSYFLLAFGVFGQLLLEVPDVAASAGLGAIIPPAWLPKYTILIAVLTMCARLRSILWRDDRHEEAPHDQPDR